MSIKSKQSFQGMANMKYNDLQIKILQYLYIHPEGVTGAKLASHCGVSLNTIRREFVKIYDLPREEGFEVISRPSIGYQLEVLDRDKTGEFFHQLNKKMNNPLFDNNDPKAYKVNAIIRKLLTKNYYINLIQLTELFSYSESSLRRDLKEVDRQLQAYHLVLRQKKGYGFYIEGDEIHKRLCLLAQHKLFVNLTEGEQKLEQEFQHTLGMGDLQMKKCTRAIRRKLFTYKDFSYKLIDVQSVVQYIPLIRSRYKYVDQVVIDPVQMECLERSGAIDVARELLMEAKGLIEYDEREIVAFAAILLGYRTIHSLEQLQNAERMLLERNVGGILAALDRVIHISESMTSEDVNAVLCCLYNAQNRMMFSVVEDKETYRKLKHTSVFTEDLCFAVKDWIEEQSERMMPENLELSFYFVLDHVMRRNLQQKDHLKLVLISSYGSAYGEYCRDALMHRYAKDIESIEVLEYTQIHTLEQMEFDRLVTDIRVEMLDPALKSKVCFLETQDIVSHGCQALSELIEERNRVRMQTLIKENLDDEWDFEQLQGHIKQKYKKIPIFTCHNSGREPGIYICDLGEHRSINGKIIRRAAVVSYHKNDFMDIQFMERELLENRK